MIFFLALAAALAGIKQEDVHLDRSMSLSPPMSANTSATSAAAIYPAMGLQQAAAASAFGMLSPTQLLAANRQAAAFMAQLPMSTLANTLFPPAPSCVELGELPLEGGDIGPPDVWYISFTLMLISV